MAMFEFKIVDGKIDEVEKEVNRLAQSGWSIHGSIQVRTLNGVVSYTQVMVKSTYMNGSLF